MISQQWDYVRMDKNSIYDMLRELSKHEISDIHMAEWQFVYVRNSSWDLVKVDNLVAKKGEMWWLVHDIVSPARVEILLDWSELDSSCQVDSTYFRVNIYTDRNWIRLAFRKIPSNLPTLESVWLEKIAWDFLKKDKWLILVTWPTWSWKSTSMASMINYINENRKVHILTMEDPIEFIFENKKSLITQREIYKNSGSWTDAMKYALRQDPDVIMVWEMRDVETIQSVLSLVETWHLVISTLHTVDAAQTITRIIDVFPPHKQDQIAIQLSLSLELVISQRLLPTREWNGRVCVRDILVNTNAVSNNIRQRKIPQISSIMETWFRYWMKTMDQSMAEVVVNWKVHIDTVLPRVKNLESFKILLNSYKNETRRFNPID